MVIFQLERVVRLTDYELKIYLIILPFFKCFYRKVGSHIGKISI